MESSCGSLCNGLGLAAVLATLTVSVSGQTPLWQDLLVVDCAKQVHLFPSNPERRVSVGGNVLALDKIVSHVSESWKRKAECHCPALSDQDLDRFFGVNMFSLIDALESPSSELQEVLDAADCDFDDGQFLGKINGDSVLPDTCTTDRWLAGEPCLAEWDLSSLFGPKISLQFAISACGSDPMADEMPYVSVSCTGEMCNDFMRPCGDDSDCDYGYCSFIFVDDLYRDVFSPITDFLDSTNVWPANLGTRTCSINGESQSSAELGEVIWDTMMEFLSRAWAGEGFVRDMHFCHGSTYHRYVSLGALNVMGYPLEVPFQFIFDEYVGDMFGFQPFSWFGLGSWDGVLDSGHIAVTSNRLSGADFPLAQVGPIAQGDESDVVLVHTTCDGRISVLPNSPLSAVVKLPEYYAMADTFFETIDDIVKCREPDASTQDLKAAFHVLSPDFWMHFFSHETELPFAPSLENDWKIVGMPETCMRSSSGSSCNLVYHGLEDFLGTGDDSFSLRLAVEECPGQENSIPSITARCEGRACEGIFYPWITDVCQQDSDCPSGRSCTTIPSPEQDIVAAAVFNAEALPLWEWGELESVHTYGENGTIESSENATDIRMYVQEAYSRFPEYTPTFEWLGAPGPTTFIGVKPWEVVWAFPDEFWFHVYRHSPNVELDTKAFRCDDGTFSADCFEPCWNENELFADIWSSLRDLTGQTKFPSSIHDENPIGFCQTDIQLRIDENAGQNVRLGEEIELSANPILYAVWGLEAAEADPCVSCEGTCSNGVCDPSTPTPGSPGTGTGVSPSPAIVAASSLFIVLLTSLFS